VSALVPSSPARHLVIPVYTFKYYGLTLMGIHLHCRLGATIFQHLLGFGFLGVTLSDLGGGVVLSAGSMDFTSSESWACVCVFLPLLRATSGMWENPNSLKLLKSAQTYQIHTTFCKYDTINVELRRTCLQLESATVVNHSSKSHNLAQTLQFT
jgi:hypothetical protein